VNLLAKPIPDVHTAVDFSSIMVALRNFGVVNANSAGRLSDAVQAAKRA